MAAAATMRMTLEDGVTRYPNPVHTVPLAVRTDGDRKLGEWNVDELKLEGNQGGVVRLPLIQPMSSC